MALAEGIQADNSRKISLPDGAGKDQVAERCAQCHSLEMVVASTRSPAEWEIVTNAMVKRGMSATPAEVQLILSYLKAHYRK